MGKIASSLLLVTLFFPPGSAIVSKTKMYLLDQQGSPGVSGGKNLFLTVNYLKDGELLTYEGEALYVSVRSELSEDAEEFVAAEGRDSGLVAKKGSESEVVGFVPNRKGWYDIVDAAGNRAWIQNRSNSSQAGALQATTNTLSFLDTKTAQ